MRIIFCLTPLLVATLFSCAPHWRMHEVQVHSGCQYDNQCKGIRVCEDTHCVALEKEDKDDAIVETSKIDIQEQVVVAPNTCEEGNATECYNLGMARTFGVGVSKDEGEARAYFQKACRGGHIFGCVNLWFLLEKKDDEKTEDVKSSKIHELSHYENACENEEAEACFQVARFFDRSLLQKTKKDLSKARKSYSKACKNGHGLSCAVIARMWQKGVGGPLDKQKAVDYYSKACEKEIEDSCEKLKRLEKNLQKK
ncbi:MAG: sel1 repeat family protein [Proteobacteria bacterium]|nr:sel1 repeat family protein [Pseudomonadota bacterium]